MSATRLAAKASFRRRRTMKQRLEARGVRNLPGTPAAPQGRSFTFDDGEEQNTARRSLRLSALSKGGDGVGTGIDASVQRWVRVPAAEEDGGGHYYVPATVVGTGKRSGTVVCQTDGGAGEDGGRAVS